MQRCVKADLPPSPLPKRGDHRRVPLLRPMTAIVAECTHAIWITMAHSVSFRQGQRGLTAISETPLFGRRAAAWSWNNLRLNQLHRRCAEGDAERRCWRSIRSSLLCLCIRTDHKFQPLPFLNGLSRKCPVLAVAVVAALVGAPALRPPCRRHRLRSRMAPPRSTAIGRSDVLQPAAEERQWDSVVPRISLSLGTSRPRIERENMGQ